jgi:hypothetical protein
VVQWNVALESPYTIKLLAVILEKLIGITGAEAPL